VRTRSGRGATATSDRIVIDTVISKYCNHTPLHRPTSLLDLELSFGPKDAPIKVQWYVDLTSPFMAKSAVVLQQFLAAHGGAVQVEFKNFPLQNHDSAMLVHEFALAAAAQGKFWSIESLLLADTKTKRPSRT